MIIYYMRDKENKPRITVAVDTVVDLDGNLHMVRGLALCSMNDNPNKKVGRHIAKGMLRKARLSVHNREPIMRDEALEVLENCGARGWGWCPDFKAEFGTTPMNEIEKKFMEYKAKEFNEASYVCMQPIS